MGKMNKNYGLFGVALQTEKGTAASAPTVSFHASGDSNGLSAERTLESINLTKGSPTTAGSYIKEIAPKFEVTTLGFPSTLALLAYAALGSITSTGADPTYTHTIKAGEALPYVTVFEQKGASDAAIVTMQDAKVDSLKMSAEGVQPIAFDVAINGCQMNWTDETSWTGPAFNVGQGWFVLADANVLFSLSTGEPVAVPVDVTLSKLEMEIANSVEGKSPLGSAAPNAQEEGGTVVTVSIEGTTSSTAMYREVMTGSKTGTSLASKVVTGALQMSFKHSTNDDYSFTLKLPAIPWNCDAMGVSTEGGPFDLKLSTDGALDLGEGAIQIIIVDGTASYVNDNASEDTPVDPDVTEGDGGEGSGTSSGGSTSEATGSGDDAGSGSGTSSDGSDSASDDASGTTV